MLRSTIFKYKGANAVVNVNAGETTKSQIVTKLIMKMIILENDFVAFVITNF